MSALSRYRVSEPRENLASDSRLSDRRRFGVEGNGQHAAANIPADSLRIQEFARGNGHTDAYILGQMHIGHHSNALHIWRASQALDCFGHFVAQWSNQPASHRRHLLLIHMRCSRVAQPQMRVPVHVCD
jgi:hypothetical protein